MAGADVVMGRRRSLLVRLQDGSGTLSLRFYHFSQAQKDGLKRGTHLRCYGEVRPGASGLEIYHPEYRALNGDEPIPVEQTLTPIYPTTEGLTQQRLRQLSQQALAMLGPSSRPTGCRRNWPAITNWPARPGDPLPAPAAAGCRHRGTGRRPALRSCAWPSKNC